MALPLQNAAARRPNEKGQGAEEEIENAAAIPRSSPRSTGCAASTTHCNPWSRSRLRGIRAARESRPRGTPVAFLAWRRPEGEWSEDDEGGPEFVTSLRTCRFRNATRRVPAIWSYFRVSIRQRRGGLTRESYGLPRRARSCLKLRTEP